jgi:uncharacterized membrane protein YoaT (DUF817 family)
MRGSLFARVPIQLLILFQESQVPRLPRIDAVLIYILCITAVSEIPEKVDFLLKNNVWVGCRCR